MAYNNVDNYFEQSKGGTDNKLILAGTVDMTGDVKVESVVTANALTLTPVSAASTVCEVEISLVTGDGVTRTGQAQIFDCWLSDAASGAGITGTTASGTVTAKAASGAVIDTYTAKKSLRVQALASGSFVLEITDSAKTAFYVCVQNPCTGIVHTQLLATGDYGA